MRPHDLHLATSALPDAVAGTVQRITRVGHEVRIDVAAADEVTTVQLTRAEARTLGVEVGTPVWARPVGAVAAG